MRAFLRAWGIAGAVLLLLDGTWLLAVAKEFYRSQIGYLFAPTPRWGAAVLFYLLYASGLALFVVGPAVRAGSPGKAALQGAFFGLVAYAVYDLTNLATVKGWPLPVTVVDLAWGAFASMAASFAAAWACVRWP